MIIGSRWDGAHAMVSMQRITLFGWNICNGINAEDDRVQMCTSTRQRRLQVTDRHEVYREGRAPEEDLSNVFVVIRNDP